jgi:hypothetical protein
MKKRYKSYLFGSALALTTLLVGSQALANHPSDIYLRDHTGKVIMTGGSGDDLAFSSKGTCGHCHEYEKIEAHSYHSQLTANQHFGWNAWKYGNWNSTATKGKPWVQSPGHVGKW